MLPLHILIKVSWSHFATLSSFMISFVGYRCQFLPILSVSPIQLSLPHFCLLPLTFLLGKSNKRSGLWRNIGWLSQKCGRIQKDCLVVASNGPPCRVISLLKCFSHIVFPLGKRILSPASTAYDPSSKAAWVAAEIAF